VWDMITGKEVRRLVGAGDVMVAAPDGKTLITNNGALQRWDLGTGKALYPDNFDAGHVKEVQHVIFSPGGKHLVSAGADGSVRLWDTSTGRALHVWRAHDVHLEQQLFGTFGAGVRALDMTPDGRFIASAGSDEHVQIWDTVSGKRICNITLPPAAINEHGRWVHIRLSAEGKKAIALFGATGRTYSTGQPAIPETDWRVTWDLPSGNLSIKQPLEMLSDRFSGLSRDGKNLVTGGNIVNVRSPKVALSLEGADKRSGLTSYVISPDGSLIAGDFRETKNNVTRHAGVRIWETATGKTVAHLTTKSWSGQLLFHPSDRFLAVNDLDGIHLWDIAAAKKVSTRKLPERIRASTTRGTYSSCFAFTPDGKRMATGHTDGTILLWDVDLPAAQATHLAPKEIEMLWAALKDTDAGKAWQAVWRLADSPDEAIPLLRKLLKPVPPAPADVTDPLLADLGSASFAKREAASKQLKELGILAESALREKLDAKPTLEIRQRIEPLLKAVEETPQPLSAETLRDVRAVAVLSRIDSQEARHLLEGLSTGIPSAPLTCAAKATLGP
jgi:WD40 repeat protein